MTERKVVVSSDQIGLLGRPGDLMAAYRGCEKYLGETPGVEVIGWRHQVNGVLAEARKGRFEVAGIHGRCGLAREPSWPVRAVDGAIMGIEELARLGENFPEAYLLVHEPELKIAGEEKIWRAVGSKRLMVENSLTGGQFQRTVEIVKKWQKEGKNVGMMVDLYHLYLETGKNWRKMIGRIKGGLEGIKIISFHVPVGTREADSFDGEFWERNLSELREILERAREVVIENQRGGIGMFLPGYRGEENIARNKEVLGKLREAGII